jgi:hypothetical protein
MPGPSLDNLFDDDIPVLGGEVLAGDRGARSQELAPPPAPPRPSLPVTSRPDALMPELSQARAVAPSFGDNEHRRAVHQVIERQKLAFATPEAHQRCVIAGETFLRGVRTEAQVRERLLLAHDQGGAGLSEVDARTCLVALAKAADELTSQVRKETEGARRAYVARNVEAAHADVRQVGSALDSATPRAERPVAVPVVREKMPDRPPGRPPSSVPVVRPVDPVAAPSNAMGPLVADVQFAPKIVGPVDELRSMSLEDFRRLSRHSREAADRVRSKIEVLSRESYDHKRQGIDAWNAGPVHRLYLDYLREVLAGTPPSAVTAARRKARLPTLSDEEFRELMELSQKLRYE